MANLAPQEGLLILVLILVVFIYPALCLSRIAGKLGRSPTRYALFSLLPLGSLVALGVLAFAGAQPRAGSADATRPMIR